ncbi:hypothetical protein BLJ79_12235 [Arthrobacter sp. UCD-GKA]|uniref:hypothetical protein n=1 Tax=Arthrobacter sp. UCD-GKA TaxID=1913576 RepID=UPI0008DE1DC6|nr:hypothetical protein [Arthrobacter sp. UCD-GKA]OIH84229.1 hypothetical protein BLJ79_12235 [Arthrobacter sp. UCD-GKA]
MPAPYQQKAVDAIRSSGVELSPSIVTGLANLDAAEAAWRSARDEFLADYETYRPRFLAGLASHEEMLRSGALRRKAERLGAYADDRLRVVYNAMARGKSTKAIAHRYFKEALDAAAAVPAYVRPQAYAAAKDANAPDDVARSYAEAYADAHAYTNAPAYNLADARAYVATNAPAYS